MSKSNLFIGLISGTSVDGVDCVLVQFEGEHPSLLETHFVPTPGELRLAILFLCTGTGIDLRTYGETDIAIGRFFAAAANELLEKAGLTADKITAIGSHGQTVFHEPNGEHPFTLQLGDPNTIAHLTRITTVADLRRRDMVAGGEGAPLAPLLHRNCFHSPEKARVIANIGGIANITVLDKTRSCSAFDTGPGNILMDYWIEKHRGSSFDRQGEWAAAGEGNDELLQLLLEEPYFSQPPPKSTGRELFNGSWLEEKLGVSGEAPCPEDVQATLLELTARTLTDAILNHSNAEEIFICGGGARNAALMSRLGDLLAPKPVATTETLGVHPDWVEATAFAWMAKQTLAGIRIDTRELTGASEPVILGGVYQV